MPALRRLAVWLALAFLSSELAAGSREDVLIGYSERPLSVENQPAGQQPGCTRSMPMPLLVKTGSGCENEVAVQATTPFYWKHRLEWSVLPSVRLLET